MIGVFSGLIHLVEFPVVMSCINNVSFEWSDVFKPDLVGCLIVRVVSNVQL